MRLYYSEKVDLCHFTFKCIPRETKRQSLLELNIETDPAVKYTFADDGFRNEKIIGSLDKPHEHFFLKVTGRINVDALAFEEEESSSCIGIYRYPYGKTVPGNNLTEYGKLLITELEEHKIDDDFNRAIYVMNRLGNDYSYNPGFTNVNTTAEEAFTLKNGVCQDYAHIYISLMKYMNIPARYVTGLMSGEGKSHAWVEIFYQNKWIGIDPTNKNMIDDNYIKLGHGRDADDCQINLGIMRGGGNQRQEIEVKVWKEEIDD